MMTEIIHRLEGVNEWHFVWVSVVLSEILTLIMNTINSLFWWGEVSLDLLLIGTIDAFAVSLIVAAIVIFFIKHLKRLETTISRNRQVEQSLKDYAGNLEQTNRDLAERNRQLLALQSAGATIASSLDLEYVMNTVADEMINLLKVEACSLSEWNPDEDTVTVLVEHGPDDWWGDKEPVKEIHFLEDYPLTKQVLADQRIEQMTIGQSDIDPSESANMRKMGIKTLLLMPMVFQGRAIGLVDIMDYRTERIFTEQELSLVQLLANQAASALENARLYNQAQQEIQERGQAQEALRQKAQALTRSNAFISALSQVATHITATPDLDQVLQTLGTELKQLDMNCFIALQDPNTLELVSHYLSIDLAALRLAEKLSGLTLRGFRVPRDRWPISEIMAHRKAVHISDVTVVMKSWLPNMPAPLARLILQLVGVNPGTVLFQLPLLIGKQVVGVMGVWSEDLHHDDLTAVSVFANQVAAVLENARLYERLQQELFEREQTEAALRESESKYRQLVNYAPAGIFEVDFLKQRFISVNDVMCEYSDYSREEFLSLNPFQILTEDSKQLFAERLQKILKGEQVPETVEYKIKGKNQQEFHVLLNTRWIYTNGHPSGATVVVHDITGRKQAEEQIRASLKEKEVLLQEIHHRVKNNLQIISSLLSLQSGYIKDQRVLASFRDSEERIRSMALIHEKLYRSENLAQIDFAEYAQDLTANLLRSYDFVGYGINLEVKAERIFLDIDTAVPCGLILNELVSNAIKHAFPDGRDGKIWVRLQANDSGQTSLSVSDNGVGFPAGFDFRTTLSLGLQLVHTLVNQLDGMMKIERTLTTSISITFATRNEEEEVR